jgi:23S rRNA pseudouridine1911/1915/1917 synthase
MAIVKKPAGVVVYRAEGGRGGGARAGQGRDTLLSALSHVLMPSNFTSSDDDENVPLKRPQPVHRLDRPTSGLMVIAKTKAAATYLAQQFEYRKAKKSYVAIVNGSPVFNSELFVV